AAVIVRLDLPEGSEDRRHRVVHPDIDRAELALDELRRVLDLRRVGDVGRHREGTRAGGLDIGARTGETIDTPRKQANASATPSKLSHGRAPDAGGCARYHDHLVAKHRAHPGPQRSPRYP